MKDDELILGLLFNNFKRIVVASRQMKLRTWERWQKTSIFYKHIYTVRISYYIDTMLFTIALSFKYITGTNCTLAILTLILTGSNCGTCSPNKGRKN